MPAPSPLGPQTDLVSFSIKANGRELDPASEVLAIHLEHALDRTPAARLTLRGSAPGEPPTPAPLSLGDIVEIGAGYDGANQAIYSGVVTACGRQQTNSGTLQIFSCRGAAAASASVPGATVPPPAPVLTLTSGVDVQEFALDETADGITGVVRFQGSALAEPGRFVTLAGFGGRFDGDTVLRSVLHRISDGNWTTTVSVGFEPTAAAARPPGEASGIVHLPAGVSEWKTPGGLRLQFDDTKKVITIATPSGSRLVLSDDAKAVMLTDQNGNAVKLDATGLALTSPGNITISATQNLLIESRAGTLTAKGAAGLTAAGLNVSLSADAAFSAKGNATAELRGGATTTIKGAMVMIN